MFCPRSVVLSDLEPSRVVGCVQERLSQCSSTLLACWVQVAVDNRRSYATTIADMGRSVPIAALIVRRQAFENPNLIFQDFAELLLEHRDTLTDPEFVARVRGAGRLAIVLIGRSEFSVSQIDSPITLPDWFPLNPGITMDSRIEDLTWSAGAPINCPEARISDLSRLIWELEGVLIKRIERVHNSNHRLTNSFLSRARRNNESIHDILADATNDRANVSNPSGFRPSIRHGGSLVARFWLMAQGSSPDELKECAISVSSALFGDAELSAKGHESLVTVLSRPSAPITDAKLRWAANFLVTLRAACQLVTAAAHSDDYSGYPVALLRAASMDIRRALTDVYAELSQ